MLFQMLTVATWPPAVIPAPRRTEHVDAPLGPGLRCVPWRRCEQAPLATANLFVPVGTPFMKFSGEFGAASSLTVKLPRVL